MTITEYSPNVTIMNAEPMLKRIRRKLAHLQPPMTMYWSAPHKGYLVADTTAGRSYGPYAFEHMGALAAHVGALHKSERLNSLMIKSLAGVHFPQLPKLPAHLKFAVVTPQLKAALELLGEHGYVVHQLISGKLKPKDPVTGPVTNEAGTHLMPSHEPKDPPPSVPVGAPGYAEFVAYWQQRAVEGTACTGMTGARVEATEDDQGGDPELGTIIPREP